MEPKAKKSGRRSVRSSLQLIMLESIPKFSSYEIKIEKNEIVLLKYK